jgi:hypothetical protein
MFSRIMRRPAGLVSMALRKTFRHLEDIRFEATPPAYWHDRYSNAALSLETPPAGAAERRAVPAAEWTGAPFAAHVLQRQQGRAASFLASDRKPAAAARPTP